MKGIDKMKCMNTMMEYGRTSPNRTVYASDAVAPSGYAGTLCAIKLKLSVDIRKTL